MNQLPDEYQIVSYPKILRWGAAAYRSTHHKPMMHGLIEVDVTRARASLHAYKAREREPLSFPAFLVVCLGKAVDEHKAVQAFRKGSKQLMVLDDVDACLPVEWDVAGRKHVTPCIIRAANRKTVLEIHHEIRAAQTRDIETVLKQLPFVPAWLFRPLLWGFTWRARRNPRLWKQNWGTVGMTAVGMFGHGAGWGFPPAAPTLMVTVGSIGTKPGVVDGQIAIRDYLSLTVSFDHEIIDGAPAARFTQRLKELIESGYGLAGGAVASEQAVAQEPLLQG